MNTTKSYYYAFAAGMAYVSILIIFSIRTSIQEGGDARRRRRPDSMDLLVSGDLARRVFDWYLTCLDEQPVLTKSATTGFIQYIGDYVAQSYEAFRIRQQEHEQGKTTFILDWIWMTTPTQNYDLRRGLSMAADGMFLSGPLMHYAFEFLEKILPTTEEEETDTTGSWFSVATGTIILHVLANDYIVDSVYLLLSFLFVAIAEGHVQDLPTLIRKDLLATLQASWGTSVALMPVEYLCFSRLPLRLRVLSMNFIDILWGAVISFVAHRSRRHDHHHHHQQQQVS